MLLSSDLVTSSHSPYVTAVSDLMFRCLKNIYHAFLSSDYKLWVIVSIWLPHWV